MKLLIVCSHYPPFRSPESAHALLLCEEMAARGIEVDLLTSELLSDFPAPDGFRIHPVMKSWGYRHFLELVLFICRRRPDAVLLIYIDWIYGCHPMVTYLPAALRRVRPNLPFVTQFENQSGLTDRKIPSGIKNRVLKSLLALFAGPRGLHETYGA